MGCAYCRVKDPGEEFHVASLDFEYSRRVLALVSTSMLLQRQSQMSTTDMYTDGRRYCPVAKVRRA